MALLNFFRSISKILPRCKPENCLQQWPKSVEIFVDAIGINKLPESCKWHFWRHDCFNKWPQKGNWERHADKAAISPRPFMPIISHSDCCSVHSLGTEVLASAILKCITVTCSEKEILLPGRFSSHRVPTLVRNRWFKVAPFFTLFYNHCQAEKASLNKEPDLWSVFYLGGT